MSYRFKVERGWKNRYAEKGNWGDPDVFHVNAESEKEATDKVAALSDTDRLAKSNFYLFRAVSAEELPPEPEAAVVEAYPPYNPLMWRGTSRRVA